MLGMKTFRASFQSMREPLGKITILLPFLITSYLLYSLAFIVVVHRHSSATTALRISWIVHECGTIMTLHSASVTSYVPSPYLVDDCRNFFQLSSLLNTIETKLLLFHTLIPHTRIMCSKDHHFILNSSMCM